MCEEETYTAIRRYLTDEREPYARGTPGNEKRKIRKAAACHVVRDGRLYYQRRHKGQDEFTELEVVLETERRAELIRQAHVRPGGEHVNKQHTWDSLSQKYWWRGILKQVKDWIKTCSECQSKLRGGLEDDDAPFVRRRAGADLDSEDEDEEEEDSHSIMSAQLKAYRAPRAGGKHELIFVDSHGVVKQCLPKHRHTVLDKLNQQRLSGQFCDITLLIEGEEYRAHKAVLAACSDYFSELFIEKGAVTGHEAVVDLSGFSKATFLPLLEFSYTSSLSFNFCVMAEIASLARHLLMAEVLELCESVHRQVEEQKLMVFQSETLSNKSAQEAQQDQLQGAEQEATEAFVVAVEGCGQAAVPHGQEGVTVNALTVVTHDEADAIQVQEGTLAAVERLPVVSQADETLAVVTHGEEALAVVSASWPPEVTQATGVEVMEKQQEELPAQAFVIRMDAACAPPVEMVHLSAAVPPAGEEVAQASDFPPLPTSEPQPAPEPAPTPLKRKRGRPAKVKPLVEEAPQALEVIGFTETREADVSGDASTSDGTVKRRLRQRSLQEGGYVRLHMGLESLEREASIQKVPQKVVRRGRVARKAEQGDGDGEREGDIAPSDVGTCSPTDGPAGAQSEPTGTGSEPVSGVEGEHTCSECGLVFDRRYSLIMHTLKHEKSRGYKCSLCGKDFQYAASLRAHLARHKQKSKRASETEQGSDAQSKECPKREFVCDICGKTLPKLYSLRIHMLNHTGVRPHTCKVCGKTFTHKHNLKMHRALHDVLKQFQCTMCDKSFATKRNLEEHASLHTGESKYLCNTCGKSFHRASGLSKHLKRHQPRPEVRNFPCSYCDKSFYEAKDLQQHMNKHLGLKPFQCQVCGKCYSWKKDWYSHVKSHSVAEPFKCNICGKEFFEKALFRRHVKKATHGKKGRVKQNLDRECEHCGRKFNQLREYRRHMNNHQGVKPFECLTCGVAWADARSLKRHVRTHTGERPYVCPVCQDAHIDARSLRKHMTKHHSDYLPGKIMLEKDTLQFHNEGTQVEHAFSLLAADMAQELPGDLPQATEQIETVLVTEETIEAVQAVSDMVQEGDGANMSSLSDQGIMQVVNYVLAQRSKVDEPTPEIIQTVEVEVAHVAEVE